MTTPTIPVDSVSATIHSKRLIRRIFIFLVVIEISLVLLDGFVNYAQMSRYSQFRRMFNITREDGLATWFSVLQLFAVGTTLGLIHLRTRLMPNSKWRALGWGLLALFFIYLSADDAAEIHERIGSAFKIFGSSAEARRDSTWAYWLLKTFPSYPWQITVGPVFALVGLFMITFLWREVQSGKLRLLLLAGLSFNALAIGIDFVEGTKDGYTAVQSALALDGYTVRHFAKSIEEFLEMFGTTLLLICFLRHLFSQTSEVHLQIE